MKVFSGIRISNLEQRPGISILLWTFLWSSCGCSDNSQTKSNPELSESKSEPMFSEITAEAGIDRTHKVTPQPDFPMPQIMGSGCALVRLNEDELLDILLVPGEPPASSEQDGRAICAVLIQSEDGRFADVSEKAGLAVAGFGMGVFPADIDNDGDIDILLTGSAGVTLFRNDGDLQFRDVSESAGVASSRWATAAVFFDYNRDGWLDLLVVNYVDYFPGSVCEDGSGRRDYCGPLSFEGTADLLYRNLGGEGQPGIFEDVTVISGLAGGKGKGLGAVCSDMNDDGLPDIYVANDMEANRLWIQDAAGHFQDEANLRGCSVDLNGRPQASMGTAWADFDLDGQHDIFLTHLRGETNTMYRQVLPGVFLDQTATTGLGEASLNFTGFGVVARDLDLDGWIDLTIVNGRVMRSALLNPTAAESHWGEYAERNQLFMGDSEGRFRELAPSTDPFLQSVEVSRGLAAGDIDHDGDIDLLVTNTAAPARLFRNVAPRKGHWLSVQADDPLVKRDSPGAVIIVNAAGNQRRSEVQPYVGYLSTQDSRVHFGLGPTDRYESIEVIWPHGPRGIERFSGGPADRVLRLERGTGIAADEVDAGGVTK